MDRMHIAVAAILLSIIGIIFFSTQKSSIMDLNSPANQVPTLPPESALFQPVQGSQQTQQQQSQQQVLGNQTQQSQPQQQVQQPDQPLPTIAVPPDQPATVSAEIKTSKGTISVSLNGVDAPHTVANFIQKAKSGFYTNLTFHRVEDWVIQGGDPNGDGTGGGKMPSEYNNDPFTTGSLGVARGSDRNINNDAQFFITKSDASWLNGDYTNFGKVTQGMDVVNQIQIGDKILSVTIDQ